MDISTILSKTAYNEICRLCLNVEDATRYYSLFEIIPDFHISANEAMKTFQLIKDEISPDDQLPHQVCLNCRELLKLFLDFKLKIDNSRLTLLEALANELVEQVDQIEDTEEKSANFEFLSIERLEKIEETQNEDEDESVSLEDPDTTGDLEIQDENPEMPTDTRISEDTVMFEDVLDETLEIDSNDSGDYVESAESFKDDSSKICKVEDFPILHCDICLKEYKKTYHLKRHIKIFHKGVESNMINHKKSSKRFSEFCEKCGKRFYSLETYEDHKKAQKCVPAENINCRFCDLVLENVNLLEEHIKNLHPHGKRHLCPICNKSFPSVSNRNTHIQSHNMQNTFVCNQCNQGFKSSVYLSKHKKTHDICENVCPICSQKFYNLAKFEYHLKAHEDKKKYQCQYCDKSYMQFHHKANHERTHTGERPYLCNVCGKDFKQECNFKLHLRIHSGERPFSCDVKDCNKTFIQRGSYMMHLRHHNNDRKYQCHHCGKSFIQKSSLTVHLRTHTGEKPFQCTQCNKSFIQAQQLKYHYHSLHNIGNPPSLKKDRSSTTRIAKDLNKQPSQIVHPYVCHLCNRSFKVPSSLSKHLKTHSETRKHVCNQCSNQFKRAEHLRIHINGVHLKQKNFPCDICNKKFAQCGDRNIHMKRHQNLKPHVCSYCKKPFRLLKALKAHERIHTGEKIYRCEFCQENFMTYTALASHTVKHQDGTIATPQLPIQIISKPTEKVEVETVDYQEAHSVIAEGIIGSHEMQLIEVPSNIIIYR